MLPTQQYHGTFDAIPLQLPNDRNGKELAATGLLRETVVGVRRTPRLCVPYYPGVHALSMLEGTGPFLSSSNYCRESEGSSSPPALSALSRQQAVQLGPQLAFDPPPYGIVTQEQQELYSFITCASPQSCCNFHSALLKFSITQRSINQIPGIRQPV